MPANAQKSLISLETAAATTAMGDENVEHVEKILYTLKLTQISLLLRPMILLQLQCELIFELKKKWPFASISKLCVRLPLADISVFP